MHRASAGRTPPTPWNKTSGRRATLPKTNANIGTENRVRYERNPPLRKMFLYSMSLNLGKAARSCGNDIGALTRAGADRALAGRKIAFAKK